MFRVVILHPVIDARERASGVGKRIDADIIALEGLHEGFGHAVALGAFHRREARLEVQGHGDLEGAVGSEDRSIAIQASTTRSNTRRKTSPSRKRSLRARENAE